MLTIDNYVNYMAKYLEKFETNSVKFKTFNNLVCVKPCFKELIFFFKLTTSNTRIAEKKLFSTLTAKCLIILSFMQSHRNEKKNVWFRK